MVERKITTPPVQRVRYRYRPTDTTEWRTMKILSRKITEATINNLNPGREYEFMVLSQDKHGDGMFSKTLRIFTQPSTYRIFHEISRRKFYARYISDSLEENSASEYRSPPGKILYTRRVYFPSLVYIDVYLWKTIGWARRWTWECKRPCKAISSLGSRLLTGRSKWDCTPLDGSVGRPSNCTAERKRPTLTIWVTLSIYIYIYSVMLGRYDR